MSRVARSDTRRRLVVVILHRSADARSVRLGWVREFTGQKNCRHSRTKSALSSLICRATIHSHSDPPFVLPTPGYSDDRYGADSVNTAYSARLRQAVPVAERSSVRHRELSVPGR